MAVSVTGPRAVNELGGPVTPGTCTCALKFLTDFGNFNYCLTYE